MQNEPVPTAGHWNIMDIYSPGKKVHHVSHGRLHRGHVTETQSIAKTRSSDDEARLLARAPDGAVADAAGVIDVAARTGYDTWACA